MWHSHRQVVCHSWRPQNPCHSVKRALVFSYERECSLYDILKLTGTLDPRDMKLPTPPKLNRETSLFKHLSVLAGSRGRMPGGVVGICCAIHGSHEQLSSPDACRLSSTGHTHRFLYIYLCLLAAERMELHPHIREKTTSAFHSIPHP